MPIESLEFTTSGFIEVFAPDGTYISRHRLVDEARESAIRYVLANGVGGTYRFVSPETTMTVQVSDAPTTQVEVFDVTVRQSVL